MTYMHYLIGAPILAHRKKSTAEKELFSINWHVTVIYLSAKWDSVEFGA